MPVRGASVEAVSRSKNVAAGGKRENRGDLQFFLAGIHMAGWQEVSAQRSVTGFERAKVVAFPDVDGYQVEREIVPGTGAGHYGIGCPGERGVFKDRSSMWISRIC